MQEAEPAGLGPAPAPAPAQAPPSTPRQPPATLQQLLAAFKVDHLSGSNKQKLDNMATELGLGGASDKVRQIMDAMVIMAAETVASQPQPQQDPESEEAKCQ